MEFALWIYKPLEDAKIEKLMNPSLDLSVRLKNGAPEEPLSGEKAEAVFYGTTLKRVQPSMEYKTVRRREFLREPLLGVSGSFMPDFDRQEAEEEEIGVSVLRVFGRLYYAEHNSFDTLKLLTWATEAPGKDKGFRTVLFATFQDKDKAEGAPVNFRKVVLPKAFVESYEEYYDDKDGMGSFQAVFRQSVAELTEAQKHMAEAAMKAK